MREYYADRLSPVGMLRMSCRDGAVTGLWFIGQRYFAATLSGDARCDPDAPPLRLGFAWLEEYFAGAGPEAAALPLDPAGTEFRRAVWDRLRAIPCGQTLSYGALAASLAAERGRPVAAQAVGSAVGHNPISILIPCHRVVGADGSLTGYAGGLNKKLWLLRHEGANLPARGKGLDAAPSVCYSDIVNTVIHERRLEHGTD